MGINIKDCKAKFFQPFPEKTKKKYLNESKNYLMVKIRTYESFR